MDAHLDVHPSDFPPMLPVVGRITGVYPRDNINNPTGVITIYQVTCYPQCPATPFVLPFVAAKGLVGGNETEDPYIDGQWVIVCFFEGHPNRPYIDGRWIDQINSTIAEMEIEHPQVKIVRNGLVGTIDKDGNAEIQLVAQKSLKIKDHAGDVIMEIVHTGVQYEVHLGGDAGLRGLMTDDIIALFNDHTHLESGGGITLTSTTGVPPKVFATGNATSITKAK